MTETQSRQPAKKTAAPRAPKSDVDVLAKSLDGSNAQRAKAIAEFVDGRITTALKGTHDQLEELVREQRETIEKARAIPAEDRDPAVTEQVDDATDKVRAVASDTNDLTDRHNRGEDVRPEEIEQADKRADEAREAVSQAKSSVEQQLADLKEQGSRHQAILAVKHDGERPKSRLDAIEEDVRKLKSSHASLSERIESAQTSASQAVATARASASSLDPLKRAASWALITFVVVFVLYLLIWGTSGLDWRFRDQFAWPFGLAFVAWCIGLITAKSGQDSDTAQATSEEKHDQHDDSRISVMRDDRDHDEEHSSRSSSHAHAGR